jgi:DNA-binding transcriptional LysR family regulator
LIKLFTLMKGSTDFAAIEAFARVAEAGSFRGAALALGAPASTVSVRISRLEQRLGAKLFTRTTRRVSLTDEGRLYFERVRSALDAMGEAERIIASRSAKARGHLRVAAPTEFGQAVMGRVIGRYVKRHPDVDVELALGSNDVDLVRDGYDVVLMTEPPVSSSLVARKVGVPMRHRLFASPAYVARAGLPKHPRDLAKHACLTMASRSSPGRRKVSANSWPVLRDLAVAGCGIARLPEYLGLPGVADGSLVPVLEGHAAPAEQMYVVYAQSAFVPVRISAFVTELAKFLDVWPGCLRAGP